MAALRAAVECSEKSTGTRISLKCDMRWPPVLEVVLDIAKE
jgi:hypothetical protein